MADNKTIRLGLVDAINQMMRLSDVCDDPDHKFEINLKVRALFKILDRVIVTTLQTTDADFEQALLALDALTQQANSATASLTMVAETITKAADAIGKIEKLVAGVVGILAI